ncbi:MAG TPA: heavy metal translocating P-type ATPase metal-binding domain-containing protein [Cyclobacteriaceae bacterium]|nr:heavy metal translocating P-type ATPase metal-binding domain-containing protein [Cyclobacteriaceae bacterium]
MSETLTANKTKITCSHCGDTCADEHIYAHEKDFCCRGCLTVYELLHEAGLEAYYDSESIPGISFRSRTNDEQFGYLDHPDIQQKLLAFNTKDFARIHFFLPSIHCSSCVWLLENLNRLNDGVKQVQVNFGKREANISFNPSIISLRKLAELLHRIGYTPQISLAQTKKTTQPKTVQRIGLKIGIAGFSFGNIMLLSFPEYLGIDGLHDHINQFIGYLNILLALPVFLYCSIDYYKSAWKGLQQKFINIDIPIALGILTLFFRSSYEILSGTGAGYMDSLAGLLFFLLIGKWFQSKTYEGLAFDRDYTAYFPLAVTRLSKQQEEIVLVDDLKIDDTILIRNNEIIPADSTLLSEAAAIDYSFVTGESAPVPCKQDDYIYAGGRQIGGSIQLKVTKESNRSYLTSLWNNEAFTKTENLQRHRAIDKISKHFTIIILSIAFGAAIFWALINPANIWQAFTAVLIVACPCALAMATPFSNGNVMRVFGRNKFYLKHADVTERLAAVNAIVFDKTGTITAATASKVEYHGEPLSNADLSRIKAVASSSLHPLSKRISAAIEVLKSKERLSSVTEEAGKGIQAVVGDVRVKLGSPDYCNANNQEHSATDTTKVHLSIDQQYKGYFAISNSLRPGLKDLIKNLSSKYKLFVLSGDNEADRTILQAAFPIATPLHFQQSPQDKLNFINQLKNEGNTVMMLGDGLNDAAALKASDVGIAVIDDTSNFSPACDGIIQGESLSKLKEFLDLSKKGKGILISSFVLSFMYNIVGLSFAVAAMLTPIFAAILMPISSITVVSFTTLSIALLAQRKKL